MSRNSKLILKAIGAVWFVLAMIVALAIRFSNPELTETQLLINYLPVWIIVAVFSISGIFMTTL